MPFTPYLSFSADPANLEFSLGLPGFLGTFGVEQIDLLAFITSHTVIVFMKSVGDGNLDFNASQSFAQVRSGQCLLDLNWLRSSPYYGCSAGSSSSCRHIQGDRTGRRSSSPPLSPSINSAICRNSKKIIDLIRQIGFVRRGLQSASRLPFPQRFTNCNGLLSRSRSIPLS